MEVRIVEGPGVLAAIGPCSAAVRAGEFVFVSGQPGVDPVLLVSIRCTAVGS